MADDAFSVEVFGLDELQKRFNGLMPELQDVGTTAVGNYLLNVLINKEIPPYRYVSRRTAYPYAPFMPGWFSRRQFRYVMGAIHRGEIVIPYQRRGKAGGMQSAWEMHGSGRDLRLVNPSRAAIYAYDNERQARQLKLVGWLKIGQIISKYEQGIVAAFRRAVRKALRSRGFLVSGSDPGI